MKLTSRDLQLLEGLGNYGLLSTRQVEQRYFSGVDSSTVLRRLRILEDSGYLQRSGGLDSGGLVWFLSEKTAKTLGIESALSRINRNQLNHWLTLNEVRLALEGLGIVDDWKPEHVLRQEAAAHRRKDDSTSMVVPDGLMVVRYRDEARVIAVEVELELKSKSRYGDVLKEYARWQDLLLIWYITATDKIGEVVAREWESLDWNPKPRRLVWTPISELKGDPTQILLRRQAGSLWLNDVLNLHLPEKSPPPSESQTSPAQGTALGVGTSAPQPDFPETT